VGYTVNHPRDWLRLIEVVAVSLAVALIDLTIAYPQG